MRLPWKYYSKDSTIVVRFKTYTVFSRGTFKIFFQAGKYIWHTTNIYLAKLHRQELTFHEVKHHETQFLYFIAHRLQVIQLNIGSCWPSLHVRVYDGPGVKCPQKSSGANITSSAFIMLLAVAYGDNKTPLINCQPYLIISYKSTYNNMEKCMETVNQKEIHISLRKGSFGTKSCLWEVSPQITQLHIQEYALGAWARPETLLDDEYCLYGGIYVYSKRNNTEQEQEVMSVCRRYIELELTRFIPEEGTRTAIAAVVFYPYIYSTNIDHTFIRIDINDLNNKYRKFRRHISVCNNENHFETTITFPDEPLIYLKGYFLETGDVEIQYTGESDVSATVEFLQQKALAYDAYFLSSLCLIPPHYCTCVNIQAKYAHPVSYFVGEASHTEKFFSLSAHWSYVFLFDISFVSSVYVNMSACERRNHNVFWTLKFEKWYFVSSHTHNEFYIKKPNVSFPLLPSDSWLSYMLTLDELLTGRGPWWFILHVMVHSQHTDDITRVCINCLSCYRIQLKVEVLQQERNESIVYSVSDYTQINNYHPSESQCRTGIVCKTCNIILIYQYSILQHQTDNCDCENATLKVLAQRTVNRKRQLTSVTSIKNTSISKISTR